MLKLLIAAYVLAASLGLIALKLGSKSGAPLQMISGKLHLNLTPLVLVGIALYGTSFLLYTYLISKYDLGYIIPVTTGLIYIVIFTASFAVLHEVFTVAKIAGITVILLGLFLLNL